MNQILDYNPNKSSGSGKSSIISKYKGNYQRNRVALTFGFFYVGKWKSEQSTQKALKSSDPLHTKSEPCFPWEFEKRSES